MSKRFIWCILGVTAVVSLAYCGLNSEEHLTKQALNVCQKKIKEKDVAACECRVEVGRLFFSGHEQKKFLEYVADGNMDELKKMVYALDGLKPNLMSIEFNECLDKKEKEFIEKYIQETIKGE